jgi:hypothetical protein
MKEKVILKKDKKELEYFNNQLFEMMGKKKICF